MAGFLNTIIQYLPEVDGPKQKKLAFGEKLKWTLIILMLYFILGLIPLYGLGANALAQFQFLSTVLGASFGSLISLGIGPIVTASIVLQLLNGAGIIKFDLSSHEGKRRYQGVQKLLSLGFVLLEGIIYVMLGGLSPAAGIPPSVLILQLMMGGVLVMFMDEVVSKWGFGSGISLFIAAGVSQQIFIRLFSPFKQAISGVETSQFSTGKVFELVQALQAGETVIAAIALFTIIATILVFMVAVYTQAMKVEIPLSFGRVRGHGIRWPLSFFYTSNIPVILTAALLANFQLVAQLAKATWADTLVQWVTPHNIVQMSLSGSLSWITILQALVYVLIFVIFSVVFAIFWVQTAGLDARSQAKQIMNSGLQIPGFRKDQRVLERMLERYIMPLTIMGAIAVGLIASLADLTGALGSGTGILLTVMIVYRLYMDIAQQHLVDMNPAMKKFMG
ncbi:TPA: preprotein translocase subunit SecY [Candidatus Woesearchaeota archaeon]|nr:preprotein translocase subunit SecY [Candidatus Woesearchaeota archaeon]